LAPGIHPEDTGVHVAARPSLVGRVHRSCLDVGSIPHCIPLWDALRYSHCMSTQIAVRLPDEMVAFLDRTVATGRAPSRAALVASALEREMRRLAAERDAQILRSQGTADDLDDLVEWTATHVAVED
jgi:Arc/MetJ-type ribon-helix-helix transcriptional regulator